MHSLSSRTAIELFSTPAPASAQPDRAAEQAARVYCGIELDPRDVDVIIRRY
jgi:hypothetical protein